MKETALVLQGVINNTGDVMPFMEDRITEMLVDQEDEITLHHPEVILVVGVNGVGKTTTIAKLANYYTKEGKSYHRCWRYIPWGGGPIIHLG